MKPPKQHQSIQHPKGKYIEWFGENDLANEFAMIGMRHFMNAEQEKALPFLKQPLPMTQQCLHHVVLQKCL